MPGSVKFYNLFHKKSKISYKIINKKNFTYRIVLSVFDRFITKKSLKILDYGCGVGTLSLYLASKGYKVTGIDISDKAIRIAESSAKELGLTKSTKFYTLTEGNKAVESQKFDRIVLIEVIEHVPNDSRLIESLSKRLKKGGYFIISTPSTNAPLFKLGLAKNFDKKVGHLRRYTPEKLSEILKKEKLKVVMIKKTEGIMRNSLYLFPILGKLIRFIRGPISDLVTLIDNITVPLFGESNIFIVTKKTLQKS